MFKLNQENYRWFKTKLRKAEGKERLKAMLLHPVYTPLRFIRMVTLIDAEQSLDRSMHNLEDVKKEIVKLKAVTSKLDKIVRELPEAGGEE